MDDQSFNRISILQITIFMEAGLLLVASIWIKASHIDLIPKLTLSMYPLLIGTGVGLILAISSLVIFSLARFVKIFADLKEIIIEQIAPLFSQITVTDILLIAALSGFCEEIFFRGTIQSQFGIIIASLIFGICHCPSFKHISYGIWAVIAGFILGGIYNFSGNLWAPIVAHAVSNCISLLFIRFRVKSSKNIDKLN